MPSKIQSPDFVKISHATAISLGLVAGRMYRGAVNRCANLLVHYPEGCAANCAYCGLARKRPGTYRDKSFIHVDWPIYPMKEVIEAVHHAPSYVKRACISMITNGKCRTDTPVLAGRLKENTDLPISVLTCPTVMSKSDLEAMKDAGVDKIGVAVDLASPRLFEKYRGAGVNGPHRWDTYWEILQTGLDVFHSPHVGAHLMVGMGETEQEMVAMMDQLWHMGVVNHLFSFFPEKNSRLSDRPQPPWPAYLRVQLARYLIEEGLSSASDMAFDDRGRIRHFGVDGELLDGIIGLGTPFMTAGCLDADGNVACNRPFGNCLPDLKQWNYPYPPNEEEIALMRKNIFDRD